MRSVRALLQRQLAVEGGTVPGPAAVKAQHPGRMPLQGKSCNRFRRGRLDRWITRALTQML